MLQRGHSYLLGLSFSPEQACGLNRICHFLLVPTPLAIVVVSKVNTSPEPGQSCHPFPGPQRIVQRWTSTKSKMDQQEPSPGVARVSDLWWLRCDLWGDTQPQWGRGGGMATNVRRSRVGTAWGALPSPSFHTRNLCLPGSSDKFLSSTIRRGLVHTAWCPDSAISGEVSAVLGVKRWLGCVSHCPARISSQLLTQVALHVIQRLAKPNTNDLFSKLSVVCLEKRQLCFLCHCNTLFWWFRNSC